MAQHKTILIVDDHALFRAGLKAIIARETRYEVVGEAGTGREALQLVRNLKPDLILMDMALPDRSGIELTQEIKTISTDIHIMFVSMHSKIDYIVKAFQAGATGYVVKESAPDKLLEGMDSVLHDEYFMDSSVSHKVIKKLVQLPENKAKIIDVSHETLTPREQEVMGLLAEGFSTKQIAEKLFISHRTVENHRSSIMRKLDLHSNLELVRYAAKHDLIDVDLWKE